MPRGRPKEKCWEKRKDESSKAYKFFVKYRDGGPLQTIQKIADDHKQHSSTLMHWSSCYNWVKRKDAWIAYKQKNADKKLVDDFVRMRKRQMGVVNNLYLIVENEIQKYLALSQKGKKTPIVKPDNLVKMLEFLMKIERLNVGAPTEHTQVEFKNQVLQNIFYKPELQNQLDIFVDLFDAETHELESSNPTTKKTNDGDFDTSNDVLDVSYKLLSEGKGNEQ